jgi:hypothetical protein
VLGAQEKGSRASRGTIQFEMEVPKPLEWKGPWGCVSVYLVALYPSLRERISLQARNDVCVISPKVSSRTTGGRARTSRSAGQSRRCVLSRL